MLWNAARLLQNHLSGGSCSIGNMRFGAFAAITTRVPVMYADNRPIGVLTARVILRALLSGSRFEEFRLIDYVTGVGYR